jgi:hypothetical protein
MRSIGVLQIDQTPCRASYGLYTPSEFLRQTTARQKQTVSGNIAEIVADGNRMRRFDKPGNSIPEMAAEAYLSEPQLEVALVFVDRPIISYTPAGGVDVSV